MKKVALVTSITPNPYNDGGKPSGLIYECLKMLNSFGIVVDVIHVNDSKYGVINKLHIYGVGYLQKLSNWYDYESFIVYPENLLFYLPNKARKRAVVIGPDSPSLRDGRMYRKAKGLKFKIIRKILYLISLWHEYNLVKQSKRVYVVGRTDELWMCIFNRRIHRNCLLKDKIFFLRHPCLSNVIKKKLLYDELIFDKRFIFAGLINEKYEKNFVTEMLRQISLLAKIPVEIVVLGKANRWIVDEVSQYPIIKGKFVSWIKNYDDVCHMFSDVHCLPVNVGAGTKNRTLTAIANGLYIISTPMGIENIYYNKLKGVYIKSTPKDFAQQICNMNENRVDESAKSEIISERYFFRKKTLVAFKEGINNMVRDIKECKGVEQ